MEGWRECSFPAGPGSNLRPGGMAEAMPFPRCASRSDTGLGFIASHPSAENAEEWGTLSFVCDLESC